MRERITISDNVDLIDDKAVDTATYKKHLYIEEPGVNPVFDNLIAEGGENFVHYLGWLGLTKETNLLVLSSRHHFYYDHDDLKGVNILVNLRKLNQVKHLDSFLHVIFRVLPPKAAFVGCFSDSRSHSRNGSSFYHSTRIYNRFINFLDSKVDREMSKNDIRELLSSHGFKIVDMAEINGMTYFTAQNQRNSGE